MKSTNLIQTFSDLAERLKTSYADLERDEVRFDEKGRKILAFIRDHTEKMTQLLDDLLALSRLERLELRPAEIDMTEIVHRVFAELKPATPGRRIEFKANTLPPVIGDPQLIQHVFEILLTNAIEHTLYACPKVIEVTGRDDGDERVYTVRDNSLGLESPDLFESTGIGLALVERIIHRHGGRTWAEIEVGRGAMFSFALPAGKRARRSPGGKRRIEDDG